MNGLTAEVGYVSLIKKGEELCGDPGGDGSV